ncbi:unnamed protein product [Lathyrus oleraceus]|uniref:S-acyltransferase n=1 Tax=Pisum sativum TaxID=3888 RepID=A0A9D4VQ59_PEA|nr:protein S-acyltransferase 11-like [Pisum sativum]KAI5388138.1 hypothetical protein KIW84_074003 [Pisum sativum]
MMNEEIAPTKIGVIAKPTNFTASSTQAQHVTVATENYEITCWGCGLRLLLPSHAPVFKCGWCGAITDQSKQNCDKQGHRWRLLRDRCILTMVFMFMLFLIFGGVWAIYPVIYSFSLFGIFHSIITVALAIATISSFSLSAFRCAGTPPNLVWGSYPTVGNGDLENYTFCHYCSKPKSPRTHHCRSCGKCILDMDHHCPFIGNCVGASNHRSFIAFLISGLFSTIYISLVSAHAGLHMWPPLTYSIGRIHGTTNEILAWRIVKETFFAFLRSVLLLSTRGFILVYLFSASISMMLGLSVLLWQQLRFIYEGETYLSHLSSQAYNGDGKKDCQNLVRFFGFPYSVQRFLPRFLVTHKRHIKGNTHDL